MREAPKKGKKNQPEKVKEEEKKERIEVNFEDLDESTAQISKN